MPAPLALLAYPMPNTPPDAADAPDLDISQQSYRFSVSWQAPNGRTYEGAFVHRCPTVGETVAIEAAHARRTDGQPLPERLQEMALMIEHLEVTLKQRPAWARPVADIPFPALLSAVAEEAAAHLRRFCGLHDGAGDGAGVAETGGDAA